MQSSNCASDECLVATGAFSEDNSTHSTQSQTFPRGRMTVQSRVMPHPSRNSRPQVGPTDADTLSLLFRFRCFVGNPEILRHKQLGRRPSADCLHLQLHGAVTHLRLPGRSIQQEDDHGVRHPFLVNSHSARLIRTAKCKYAQVLKLFCQQRRRSSRSIALMRTTRNASCDAAPK